MRNITPHLPPYSLELFTAVSSLKTPAECEMFFRDILTRRELEDIATRLEIAKLLSGPNPPPYLEIAQEVETSTTTVGRVANWLNAGAGGYQLVLERLKK